MSDTNKEVLTQLAIHGKAIQSMEATMGDVANALNRIAVLEEHRQSSKEDLDDIFKRLRAVEKESALTAKSANDSDRRWQMIERIIYGLVIAGLFTYAFTKQ